VSLKGKVSPVFHCVRRHEDLLGRVEVQLYAFLTSALNGGMWVGKETGNED
jgi:hypothetical protein